MALKVAVIEPVGGHGGCNYYDFSLCRSLQKAGVNAALYTCDKTLGGNEGFAICRTYVGIYGNDPAWKRGLRFVVGSVKALVGARAEGARLAHFHFYHVGLLELFNVLLARFLLYRVVITAHDVEAFKAELSIKKFVELAYSLAQLVIAHNEISKQELIAKVGISAQKIKVIRHGNHVEYVPGDLSRKHARQRLGLNDDEFAIVFFGQIKEVKGIDVLLNALPLVIDAVDVPVKLVLAGKVWKDDFSKYQDLIDKHNLAGHCSLHVRYIPDSELPDFYCAADIIALPYKKIYQSGVVLMAMSFGAPVIVSSIPGMLEVVEDGNTGFVFESENENAFAAKLIEIIRDRKLLEQVALNGHQHVLDSYSWDKIGKEIAGAYESVL